MYETKEANSLWAPIQPDNTVDTTARAAAARALLDALEELAKRFGFEVRWEREGARDVLSIKRPNVHSTCNAWLVVDEEGVVVIGRDTNPRRTPVHAKVAYDVASGTYVGTEDDAFYAPVPGEPKVRKRDALAVLSETIVPYLKYPPQP